MTAGRLTAVPVQQLPEPLRALADPQKPLPEAVQAAYEPPAHEKLNMARLVLWFTLSIGGLGLIFSLLINRSRTLYSAIVLVICIAGLLYVRACYRRHSTCGGDTRRLGVYVLPEGILQLSASRQGSVTADFVPREAVEGFLFQQEAEPYQDTRIQVQLEDGPWQAYAFPSVGMLHPWHQAKLEHWMHSGSFVWEEYKKPKNPQPEA